jgi:pimeloyl-ACP methyl ester carboxylesterase
VSLAACAPYEPVPTTPAPDPRFAVTVADGTPFSPVSADKAPSDPPTLRVAYGTASAKQYGELRVPKGKGPFPVAMMVHGGCWMGLGGTANLAALSSFLTRNGVATWTPSYRELESGGGWPNTFADWAQGLGYLNTLAETYPLDLTRITVMGHSAGTMPAVWLATGDKGDAVVTTNLPRVRAGVVIDGPLRLAEYVGVDAEICGGPVIARLVGGTPAEVPARYAVLDPAVNKPLLKRLLVVDGALPDPDPALIASLRGQGIDVEVIRTNQDDHFSMLIPGTKDFALIGPTLLDIASGR